MNNVKECIDVSKSGVFKVGFYLNNELISSGSGFIYKNYLVSNNHVFNHKGSPMDPETVVAFRFGDTGQYDNDDFRILYKHLKVVVGSPEGAKDYIVHDVPAGAKIDGKHIFELDPANAYQGQKVLILGYPFNAKVMTAHIGYISAVVEIGSVKRFQLDASVNSGNSGGPLIDPETGKVIGIVTMKQTGLTKQFEDLNESFSSNISALEATKSMFIVGGLDPLQALQISQQQMQVLARDIERSANVGIGYAFSSEYLMAESL